MLGKIWVCQLVEQWADPREALTHNAAVLLMWSSHFECNPEMK